MAGSAMQSSNISDSTDASIAAQQQAQQEVRDTLSPWTTTGKNALMVAGDLSGANGAEAATNAMGNFYTSPGYQFRLSEGLRSVGSAASANGAARSGETAKALQTYGEGLAASEFTNYYNRLYNLSNLGENAAAGVGTGALTTAQGIASTETSSANAQNSTIGNTTSGLSSTVNNLFSDKNFQNWLSGSGSSGYVDTTSTF